MKPSYGKILQDVYNVGYADGKAEAEAYSQHCGDELPVTNADKIRSMSDEELAQFCVRLCDSYYRSFKYWLEWLKKEEISDD